jgi:RNA-directed DNA polymerase
LGNFDITGNFKALLRFSRETARVWRKWLDHRSQRAGMDWNRMGKLLERYPLPRPRVVAPINPRAANL